MNRKIVAAALLSAFLTAPSIGVAEEHDLEQLVVEMAHTRQEHQALVNHYRMKAEDARATARSHQALAKTYATQRNAQPQARQHCEDLAKKFDEIANDYDGLAKYHEEMSK